MMLKDKVAVVYGAGGSIGGAVARAFADEGARVFLTGRYGATVLAVASFSAALECSARTRTAMSDGSHGLEFGDPIKAPCVRYRLEDPPKRDWLDKFFDKYAKIRSPFSIWPLYVGPADYYYQQPATFPGPHGFGPPPPTGIDPGAPGDGILLGISLTFRFR